MKCENCGAIIDDDSKFCYYCGNKIGDGSISSAKKTEKKSEISPFSIVFAIGLTISALIFFSKLYRDLGNAMTDQTSKMMMRTIFVLPVVVIAFILFFSLYRKNSKYGIVLIPYFITALWLLMWLLIEMGTFFYQRYQQLTVYVSMILIMATLTGLIFYIQNREHNEKEKNNF